MAAEVQKFLVDAGHEAEGISRNADWDTPLMAAVTCDGNDGIVRLLIEQFETGIPWQNKTGLNAVSLALSPLARNPLAFVSGHR